MTRNPNLEYLLERVPRQRVTLLQGGSRSGKTFSVIEYLIFLCTRSENMEIDITRETFKALKATAWSDFEDVLRSFGLYSVDNHNKTDGIYRLNSRS